MRLYISKAQYDQLKDLRGKMTANYGMDKDVVGRDQHFVDLDKIQEVEAPVAGKNAVKSPRKVKK